MQIEPSVEERAARTVDCPECGAKVGEPCLGAPDWPPHLPSYKAAHWSRIHRLRIVLHDPNLAW